MSSLGARISILLTLAILFVVAGATVLMLQLLAPPPGGFMRGRPPSELVLAARMAERLPAEEFERLLAGSDVMISGQPPAGPAIEQASNRLADQLRRDGLRGEVRVTEPEGGGPPTAALKLADGRWLSIDSDRPAPGRRAWTAFAFWMALIAFGTTTLVVVAVMRATRPLALLERTVAGIGPDGEFVALSEDGPPEVRATAKAINLLSSRLKDAMEGRMRLVAAAGHDLRTPMTRLRLRAEFLTDDDDRAKWLADLEELDRIADSAIRLVREEVDPDARQAVRIDVMVREIAGELTEIGLPIEAVRTTEAEASVRPLALKRALRNLAVNAATHGVSARISVEVVRGAAVVAIEDEGPGIPPALLERAFEPFFRVDPARGKATTPGAGLGLAIAKEIVARNDGTLTVANRPAGGLVQVVALPIVARAGDA